METTNNGWCQDAVDVPDKVVEKEITIRCSDKQDNDRLVDDSDGDTCKVAR